MSRVEEMLLARMSVRRWLTTLLIVALLFGGVGWSVGRWKMGREISEVVNAKQAELAARMQTITARPITPPRVAAVKLPTASATPHIDAETYAKALEGFASLKRDGVQPKRETLDTVPADVRPAMLKAYAETYGTP